MISQCEDLAADLVRSVAADTEYLDALDKDYIGPRGPFRLPTWWLVMLGCRKIIGPHIFNDIPGRGANLVATVRNDPNLDGAWWRQVETRCLELISEALDLPEFDHIDTPPAAERIEAVRKPLISKDEIR